MMPIAPCYRYVSITTHNDECNKSPILKSGGKTGIDVISHALGIQYKALSLDGNLTRSLGAIRAKCYAGRTDPADLSDLLLHPAL